MAGGLAMLFALLAVYGGYSLPGVIGDHGLDPLAIVPLIGWIAAAALAWPMLHAIPGRSALIALAVLAVGIRLTALIVAAPLAPVGDAQVYPMMAQNLIEGRGLFVDEPTISVRVYAYYPPAYPILLAAWGAIAGLSAKSYFILNGMIDAFAALMIGRIGARLGHAGAGRAAGWLYLIWPTTMLAAPYAQKEGICVALILALVIAWLKAGDAPRLTVGAAMRIGLLAAMLALTQPGFAPLAGLIGLAMLPRMGFRRVAVTGIAAMGVTAIAMLPWWLRNAFVMHAFIPMTSASGVSLWVGNNADATGNWIQTPENTTMSGELDYARYTGALAKQWIADHPVEFVRLTITKFIRALGIGHFEVVRIAAGTPHVPPSTLARLLPLDAVPHLLLLAAGSAALGLLRHRIAPFVILLLVALLAQMCLFGVWFEFGERHRVFLTPVLLLAAAMAASMPVEAWMSARAPTKAPHA